MTSDETIADRGEFGVIDALARRLREAEEAASAGLGTPAADVRPPHW